MNILLFFSFYGHIPLSYIQWTLKPTALIYVSPSVGGFHVNSVSFGIKIKHNTVFGSNHGKSFLRHLRAKNSFLKDETLYYVQTSPPFIIIIIHLIIPHTYPFLMHFRTLVHCNKHISLLVSRLLLSNYWSILLSIASGVARNCKN